METPSVRGLTLTVGAFVSSYTETTPSRWLTGSSIHGHITIVYIDFLTHLFEDGRVTLPPVTPLLAEEELAGDLLLIEYETIHRTTVPGTAPEFSVTAARWAAINLFRASQFVVYRDVGELTIQQELGRPLAEPISPAVHYSVDLVFQFLPDLVRFAISAAQHDPLLEPLYQWAREWPLSSVGMAGLGELKIAGLVEHASLMQQYVDRVIARGDESRLSDIRVREAVKSAVGMYPELARTMSSAVQRLDS